MTAKKEIFITKDPEFNTLNLLQYFPHNRTDSKMRQLTNGIIVIHDERPYDHPKPFVTVVLNLQSQDHVIIHHGDLNKILTVLQKHADPKKAMDALRKVIPPSYTKKQLKIYQEWDRRDLKLRKTQAGTTRI